VRYRRLARRSLGSLPQYKFLHEYGYDKGEVVAAAIAEDIVATVRTYYRKPGDLEPGQLVYNAAAANECGGRGKTIARTRLIPVLTILADEDLEAIRLHQPAPAREIRIRRITNEARAQGAALTETEARASLRGAPSPGRSRVTQLGKPDQAHGRPRTGCNSSTSRPTSSGS
jgi:hypothetical protein